MTQRFPKNYNPMGLEPYLGQHRSLTKTVLQFNIDAILYKYLVLEKLCLSEKSVF